MPYIRQLLDAYGEREQCTFRSHKDIKDHGDHAPHLYMQRKRFFDAEAFARFYRDNTMMEEIEALRRDMHHGVIDVHPAKEVKPLARDAHPITQPANVKPSRALSK